MKWGFFSDLVREITRVISRCEHKLSQDLYMWTRLVRISDPGQWFGKIHDPVTRVQHLVRTNSYVNATVSLVRRYGAVVCMKKRELTQDPDCTLALQHVLDLLTWASYPGQIFPVWTQVNISDDNLMMWNTWTTDPGTICEHGLRLSILYWNTNKATVSNAIYTKPRQQVQLLLGIMGGV